MSGRPAGAQRGGTGRKGARGEEKTRSARASPPARQRTARGGGGARQGVEPTSHGGWPETRARKRTMAGHGERQDQQRGPRTNSRQKREACAQRRADCPRSGRGHACMPARKIKASADRNQSAPSASALAGSLCARNRTTRRSYAQRPQSGDCSRASGVDAAMSRWYTSHVLVSSPSRSNGTRSRFDASSEKGPLPGSGCRRPA